MTLQNQIFTPAIAPKRAPASATGGWQVRGPQPVLIVIGGALAIPGTTSVEPTHVWEPLLEYQVQQTTSDRSYQIPESLTLSPSHPAEATRRTISELRRLSGLTWEQLGQLFEVSRRSVHFWASGKPLNAANEERLSRVIDIVRKADRGDARSTRAALLETTHGETPFDLLASQRFDEARALLGIGSGRRQVHRGELSAAAKAGRKPLSPEQLVGAMHDRVHRDVGRGRAAQTSRNKRRGKTR